ncbi:ABC transporter B family member 26, chloroplastic-like [Momordica charantia]|uniref:ABC transporter B family member 26, chloroplastic-like n=1 Tax=Momordica charantia TaxID=3673 RepID=A0A6J1BWQ8_MOMCH|nr:ABC transporter B family member 26, chloroplastic-like [Momordica charantia]
MDIAYRYLCISFPPFFPPAGFSPRSNSRSSGSKLTMKPQFPIIVYSSFRSNEFKFYRHRMRNSSLILRYMVPENDGNGDDNFKSFGHWVSVSRSLFPDGSWWNLDEHKKVEIGAAKPLTVYLALRRMWKLVWDSNRWVLLVAFGALTIAAISEISMPSILAASIFSASSGKTIAFAKKLQLLVILSFTSGIFSGLRTGCFGVANIILVKHLREILHSAILFQDMSFFDTETVGNLTSRLGADCQQLAHVIGNNINLITRNALQAIGALANLLTLSWPLALSTLVICSVLSAIFLLYSRYVMKTAKLNQEFTAGASEVARESLTLVKTIRICGTERKEVERYKQWLDKLAFVSTRESAAYGLWNMSFGALYRSTQVFAVLLGGISIMSGRTSAEQLTKYVLYCEWLIYATWRITDNLSSLLYSIAASEAVFQLMDLLPSEQFLSKGVKLQELTGHIQFVDVSFHYHSRDMLLEHINITLQANEVVAIVGPSGSGKSTLVNLLLRLYEPTSGQIFVDGRPLKELDIRWLREKIGFVGQEPHLFHMDIKSNIRYGCPMDTTQEDIELAAEQACAHEFISSFPNGYDTIVDDNLLSGGQKQRIAIARAILRDPAILILDEATSALDSESEHYVKGAISAFKSKRGGQKTVIVIAHRLSTIEAADKILVMDRGRVVEIGNHKELLCRDGYYAKLVKIHKNVLA